MTVFNIFGIQCGASVMICAAMARPGVDKKGQSVACLCVALTYLVFMVSDAMNAFSAAWPANAPKDGIYANFAVWSLLIAMCLSAWKSSGSHLPKTDKLMPSGRFAGPMLATIAANMPFAIGLIFFPVQFDEMWSPGNAAKLDDYTRYFLYLILGNIGKFILCNTASYIAITAANPAEPDLPYRLLRSGSMMWMYYLGSYGKDAIIDSMTGQAKPMYTMAFVQGFLVTFYVANSWAGAEYKLVAKKA